MDDKSRKVRQLKFWRLELASALEKQEETNARGKILYNLYIFVGNTILSYEYAFGNSRQALAMMKKELDNLCKSEAFEVFSKLNHSLEEPVVDEKTRENINILYTILDYLIEV